MLSGDTERIKQTIRSRSWNELKVIFEEHYEPRGLKKSIMNMQPALFEEKAMFAKPENSYRVLEASYLPEIGTDDLIEVIKQNRKKFL